MREQQTSLSQKLKAMTTSTYEIVKFENEKDFKNGWYVLDVNPSDNQVLWVSECFETEEEAKVKMAQMQEDFE